MAKQKSINLMQFIKEEKIILGAMGFYAVANNKYRKLQNISAAFFGIPCILYCVLGLIYIYYNLSNLTLTAQIFSYILAEFTYIGKAINIIYHNKHLFRMEDILRDPLFTELESSEEQNTIYKSLKLSMILKKIYITQVSLFIVIEIFMLSVKRLPLSMWFPFNEYDHFYTVSFFEILICVSGCIGSVGLDVLLCSTLDLCSTQFILLNNRLLKIGATIEDEPIMNDELLQKLQKYIKHHSHIYRFSDLIQKIFSVGIFFEIISIGTTLCFAAFSVIIAPIKSTQFATMAVFCQSMLWQIAIHCWFGQKLLNTSNQITESCYMSKWYECSLEIQKHVLMIMRRANKRVLITAAGIFPLNLKSFINVLSSSYSVFAIIWQMYDEEDRKQ